MKFNLLIFSLFLLFYKTEKIQDSSINSYFFKINDLIIKYEKTSNYDGNKFSIEACKKWKKIEGSFKKIDNHNFLKKSEKVFFPNFPKNSLFFNFCLTVLDLQKAKKHN